MGENGAWEEPRWDTGTLRIMGPRPTTIIVESRLLIREALKSLMTESSYRVVCEVGSISGIGLPTIDRDEPGLVILSAQSADIALIEAVGARRLWPDSKIILLYENASPADFQKLLTSELNGCVSWFVSPETLISTLDLIVTRDLRLMVATDANHFVIQPVRADEPHPRLTEREAQILDGLVKGHANKVIARTCDIAEETVKVHIRSILQKIRVENRTQAALWAMANGYAG
jgi:two-component system nitrate/nitrite response regulator NarL